jgi:S-DNA-T family DNA segregation ATPase FtsK/SpoIIIE
MVENQILDNDEEMLVGRLVGQMLAGSSAGGRIALARELVQRLAQMLGSLPALLGDAGRLSVRAAGMLAGALPHLPVRDLPTLRHQLGGDTETLADRVEQQAAALATGVWTVEALAGVVVPAPVIHTAKVLLHSAAEVRCVAELYAVYGCAPDERGVWLGTALRAWAAGRPVMPGPLDAAELRAIATRLYGAYGSLQSESGRFGNLWHRKDGGDRLRSAVKPVRRRIRLGPAALTLPALSDVPVTVATTAGSGPGRHLLRAAALHAHARACLAVAAHLADVDGHDPVAGQPAKAETVAPGAGPASWHRPMPELLDAPPEPATDPLGTDVMLRVGTLHDGRALLVPFGPAGHLAFATDARDPLTVGCVRTVLARLLASAPAGTVRVVVADGDNRGLLIEPLSAFVTDVVTSSADLSRVWAQADAHLRNAHAGHLVVVLALGPEAMATHHESVRGFAHAGIHAGVHLVVTGYPPHWPSLENTTHLAYDGDSYVSLHGRQTGLTDDDGGPLWLPATLDDPPDPDRLRVWGMALAGQQAEDRKPGIEVLLPEVYWAQSATDGLSVTVGRTGDRPVRLTFDDARPHWLVGGRTGTGKSVLLLDVLHGLACRYPPSELELYLLDFKDGMSFNDLCPTANDASWLPHARIVGVESDREFGLAVLRHLADELGRRAAVMKRHGASKYQDLRAAQVVLPRVVAVIDEFQVLFATDRIGREAADLLERLARQGRSYGVHLLLASQTRSGSDVLADRRASIFGQLPVRIALPGAPDALDDPERAKRLTIGTCIVDENAGAGDGEPDRIVMFPDAHAAAPLLREVRDRLVRRAGRRSARPLVFAGQQEQHLTDDPVYRAAGPSDLPVALAGRTVDATLSTAGFPLDRALGRHVAIVGSRADGTAILAAMTAGLARQHAPGTATFVIAVPGTVTVEFADLVPRLHADGHDAVVVDADGLAERLPGLAGRPESYRTYVVLAGMDALGAQLSAEPGDERRPLDDLRAVLRDGSLRGVHVLGWWGGVQRLLRDAMGPFDGVASVRENIACLVVTNVSGDELGPLFGGNPPVWRPADNRALFIDTGRRVQNTIVPFAGVGR